MLGLRWGFCMTYGGCEPLPSSAQVPMHRVILHCGIVAAVWLLIRCLCRSSSFLSALDVLWLTFRQSQAKHLP